MALGIPYVGTGVAEALAVASGDLVALSKMSLEALMEVDGVGAKGAQSVRDYFADPIKRDEVFCLLEWGVNPTPPKRIDNHPFFGKTFVLTGKLEHFTRRGAADQIKARGGKVSGSVSAKTDYLLAGEAPGSKLKKAEQLGIAILNEAQFAKQLS